jgi:hypothetical protein
MFVLIFRTALSSASPHKISEERIAHCSSRSTATGRLRASFTFGEAFKEVDPGSVQAANISFPPLTVIARINQSESCNFREQGGQVQKDFIANFLADQNSERVELIEPRVYQR